MAQAARARRASWEKGEEIDRSYFNVFEMDRRKGLVRARIFLQVAEWDAYVLTTHFMLMVVLVWILGQRVTLQGERSPFYSREN